MMHANFVEIFLLLHKKNSLHTPLATQNNIKPFFDYFNRSCSVFKNKEMDNPVVIM